MVCHMGSHMGPHMELRMAAHLKPICYHIWGSMPIWDPIWAHTEPHMRYHIGSHIGAHMGPHMEHTWCSIRQLTWSTYRLRNSM